MSGGESKGGAGGARMGRGRRARARKALLLLLLAAAMIGGAAGAAANSEELPADSASASDESDADADADTDDDSDSAPFMIVVEHKWKGEDIAFWHCSGALVSLRTGVTSAGCARQKDGSRMRELYALAAAAAAGLAPFADGARRVTRVATAGAGAEAAAAASAWGGAVLDVAVLELERPFGSAARARPILMATSPDECGNVGSVCHVVRTLTRPGQSRARLRIVDATLAPENVCAPLMRFWSALRDRALCLQGPKLCSGDWGAGVVCGGKLCGVISRSVMDGSSAAGWTPTPGLNCGDTHAAQSVARWRRFLHCAHTLRACGRGACAELCSERRLTNDDNSDEGGSSPSAPSSPAVHTRPNSPLDLAHLAVRDSYDAEEPPVSAEHPTRMRAKSDALRGDALRVERPRPPVQLLQQPMEPTAEAPTRTPQPSPPPSTPAPAAIAPLPATPHHPSAASSSTEVVTAPPPPRTVPHGLTFATPPTPVRPTVVYEPNRPDFKAGEYGDNGAEYVAPVEDTRSTTASTTPREESRGTTGSEGTTRRVAAQPHGTMPPARPHTRPPAPTASSNSSSPDGRSAPHAAAHASGHAAPTRRRRRKKLKASKAPLGPRLSSQLQTLAFAVCLRFIAAGF